MAGSCRVGRGAQAGWRQLDEKWGAQKRPELRNQALPVPPTVPHLLFVLTAPRAIFLDHRNANSLGATHCSPLSLLSDRKVLPVFRNSHVNSQELLSEALGLTLGAHSLAVGLSPCLYFRGMCLGPCAQGLRGPQGGGEADFGLQLSFAAFLPLACSLGNMDSASLELIIPNPQLPIPELSGNRKLKMLNCRQRRTWPMSDWPQVSIQESVWGKLGHCCSPRTACHTFGTLSPGIT